MCAHIAGMAKFNTTPPDLSTVAGRLRWARENAGYPSARGAAVARGWNESTYRSHEGGVRQADGLKEKHAARYARGFGVSQSWLMTGKGDPLKPDLTITDEEAALIRMIREARKSA